MQCLEDFESYKRSSLLLINVFFIEFVLKYDKIKTHGITYREELLGFRLLNAAHLSSSDETLAKATSDLKYSTMKLQSKRLFSEKEGVKTSQEKSIININIDHQISITARPLNHLIKENFNQKGLLRIGDIQMLQCQEPQTDLNNGESLIHLRSLLDSNMCQLSQNLI